MLTLGIDLSTLTPLELQRLLKSARDRGEVIFAERLQAELHARRRGPVRSRTPWTAADVVQAAVVEDAPDDDALLRRAAPLAIGLAGVAAVSIAAGWWLTRAPHAAPPAPIPAVAEPHPTTIPPPSATAIASPQAARPVVPHKATTHTAASAPRRIGSLDCGKARDRADRMVCADRGLSAQHRAMRAAYDRAVAAGADRRQLDRGQAQWREARARSDTPKQLRALYDKRIAELNAKAKKR